MKKEFKFRLAAIVICFAVAISHPAHLYAQQGSGTSATSALRDGQHDFDFNFGTWKTHITRLQHPLSGSTTRIKLEGTVTIKKVWDGRGQVEEIEADGPTGHWEGLTLFLYDPQSHQWSQTFASGSNGVLGTPIIGEFRDGRMELYGQDTFNGRSILVRGIWTIISPNTHKFEQAFSDDGGKTWEINFIGMKERIN